MAAVYPPGAPNQTIVRQSYNNSCGAACLLCAALELGAIPMPTGEFLDLALNDLETEIYRVTSENSAAYPEDSERWGYNMPSRIVVCARSNLSGIFATIFTKDQALDPHIRAFSPLDRANNLHAHVVAYNTSTVDVMKKYYSEELPTLRRLNALLESTALSSYMVPHGMERELKALRVNLFGLHYVMVRPDGSVMDPATGHNYPSIAHYKMIMAGEEYKITLHGTGLSIFIH